MSWTAFWKHDLRSSELARSSPRGRGEGSINDVRVCGVVEGKGKVTEVGSGPRGDGVVWDGEGDWRCHGWRMVGKGLTLEGGVGMEGRPGEGKGGGEAEAGEVGTHCELLQVGRKKAGWEGVWVE